MNHCMAVWAKRQHIIHRIDISYARCNGVAMVNVNETVSELTVDFAKIESARSTRIPVRRYASFTSDTTTLDAGLHNVAAKTLSIRRGLVRYRKRDAHI